MSDRFTATQVVIHNERVARGKRMPQSESSGGDERETGQGGIQSKVIKWCADQWPQWVPVFARTDLPSTLPVGCQDISIFGPWPLCICVETKSRTGKPSQAQLIWRARMSALKWRVHIVRCMDGCEESWDVVRELERVRAAKENSHSTPAQTDDESPSPRSTSLPHTPA